MTPCLIAADHSDSGRLVPGAARKAAEQSESERREAADREADRSEVIGLGPVKKREGLRWREQAPSDTPTLPAPRTLGKDSMNQLRGDCGPWNSAMVRDVTS